MTRAECRWCGLHFRTEDDYWEDSHLVHCDGNPDQFAELGEDEEDD